MVANEKTLEHLNALEDVLVKEFRLCQNLHALTKDERAALAKNDVSSLLTLVERKEALLDELGQLDDSRRTLTQETSQQLGLNIESPTLTDILPAIDLDSATRLGHLREGILALMNEVKDLTHGNRALAVTALERTDAVQAFLLSLYQTPAGYRPQNVPASREPTLSWEVDHTA
jgi:flagellar biosynthesis/type III secretory pathway chaperone